MSSARSQDTKSIYKNHLYFFTLPVNTPKMKRIPFTIASKKYLQISLTKGVQDLYSENYEMLKQTEDTNKRKDTPCSWITQLALARCPRSLIWSANLTAFLIRVPGGFFAGIHKLLLKPLWNAKDSEAPRQSWNRRTNKADSYFPISKPPTIIPPVIKVGCLV